MTGTRLTRTKVQLNDRTTSMEAKEKIGVSFGFSKKSETKRLKLTEDGANIDDKDNRDFVRVLENQEVKR